MRDCNKCIYLNITEEQQSAQKEPHICNKYEKRVFHMSANFIGTYTRGRYTLKELHPCEECKNDLYKNYKEGQK